MSGYRESIRQLKPGEPIPSCEPKRYIASTGYMRLRWKLGTGSYAETYEHRVFDGRVTTAEHVHHVNGNKLDNSRANLVEMSADEHISHHKSQIRGYQKWSPFRSQFAMMRSAYAENRRFDRDRRTDRIRQLHSQGLNNGQIGEVVGLTNSSVSRYLTYGNNP